MSFLRIRIWLVLALAAGVLPCFPDAAEAPEWMRGRHGLMVHWLYPKGGDIDRWTDAFDVRGFLDDFAASRAEWLVFTVGQCRDAWASPSAALDRHAGPGFAAKRDLVGEIAAGVHRLGKRFIAYSAVDQSCACQLNTNLVWNKEDPDHRVFSRRMTDVIRDWSRRWGRNCDGWWLDGAAKVYYPNGFDCKLWGDACRAGNPASVIAYNPGWENFERFLASDYAAGETPIARLEDIPKITSHVLFPLDGYWGAYWKWPAFADTRKPGFRAARPEMFDADRLEAMRAAKRFPDPIYTRDELFRFVRAAEANGAGVTVNVGIGETGRLNPKSLALVASLAEDAHAVWRPAPLGTVRIGGSLGDRLRLTVGENLKKLDLDATFIRPFAEKKGEEGAFVGTGNVIESLAWLAKYTGDAELVRRKTALIDAIVAAQEKGGYIGCMIPGTRYWRMWDVEDIGFILDGLVADWKYFGTRKSLEAAVRAADDVLAHWKNPPANWDRAIYDKELAMGLGHGLWALYQATGDARYRDFVAETRGYRTSDEPITLGRDLGLRGHTAGYLDTCFTQLDMYRMTGDKGLFRQTHRFYDHMLRHDGGLVSGGSGACECWSGDQEGAGFCSETCMSAYALTVYDIALRTGAEEASVSGDLMERTLYNAFFGAQSKDGRRLRYYTPLTGKRPWWPTDDYCCPCNFRRVAGYLPTYVFYVSDRGILANLYTPATGVFAFGGTTITITEETDYPTSGRVRFSVKATEPVSFGLSLRVPRWCEGASVAVDGSKTGIRAGTIHEIRRVWRTGDVVELELPMKAQAVRGHARQAGRFAVTRGPLVYALDLEELKRVAAKDEETVKYLTMNGLTVENLADVMTVDPEKLTVVPDDSFRPNGTAVETTVSLNPYAFGHEPGKVRRIRLREFADERNTLTYFRAPSPDRVRREDELFGKRPDKAVSSIRGIRLNQVGYWPDAVKRAVVADPPEGRFRVQRFEADVRCHDVYEGALQPIGGGLYEADFSSVTQPGDYRLTVGPVGDDISLSDRPGTLTSCAFVIGENIYREAERAILSFFNHQRCGHRDGWAGVCHQGPSRLVGTDRTVDLAGGFHQSCDLRKWADSSSFAVEALIRFAEATPDACLREQAEAEIRWGLDYFRRVVSPEDFVYDCQFTPIGWAPYEVWNRPAPMVAQTLVIRLLARGAAYFRERDTALSAACLAKARLACATLAAHPDFARPYVQAVKDLPPGTQGTSFYRQSCRGNLNGEVLQAAAELALARASDDRTLLARAEARAAAILALERTEEPGTFWLSSGKEAVALADFRSGTLATELFLEFFEVTRKDVYKAAFRRRLDRVLAQKPHPRQWTSPIVDNGVLAFAAYRLFGDERYRREGQSRIDFMFGANDRESSCVGGIGYNAAPKNVYGQFFPSTPQIPGGVGVHLGGEYNLPQAGGLLRLLAVASKALQTNPQL